MTDWLERLERVGLLPYDVLDELEVGGGFAARAC